MNFLSRHLTPDRFSCSLLGMDIDRFVTVSGIVADASSKVKQLEGNLSQADDTLRETVLAAYVEGMSVAAIASAAEISRQRVYRYLREVPLPDRA